MKKLILILLLVPMIFSCRPTKKEIAEKVKKNIIEAFERNPRFEEIEVVEVEVVEVEVFEIKGLPDSYLYSGILTTKEPTGNEKKIIKKYFVFITSDGENFSWKIEDSKFKALNEIPRTISL